MLGSNGKAPGPGSRPCGAMLLRLGNRHHGVQVQGVRPDSIVSALRALFPGVQPVLYAFERMR